jgi:hypothetical protein
LPARTDPESGGFITDGTAGNTGQIVAWSLRIGY